MTVVLQYVIIIDKAVADCLEKNRKRAVGIGDKL